MTDRLYYRNSALLTFEASVTRIEQAEGRALVYLDRSAFYPTSGGQSHDLGTIGGVAVIDVVETPDGDVAHVVERAPAEIGGRVTGIVDAPLRQRNRQQHTAQHILSYVCFRMLRAETLSVHLGEEYGAIELSVDSLTGPQLREAENEANRIVAAALAVEIMFVSVEEIARLPLRKPPAREGTLRVIRIGDLDWSACGGTHCQSTIEISLIKITGTEKTRGHALVTFLVGEQALADYQIRFEVTDRLAKSFTCHVADLPAKSEKLITENKTLRRELGKLQKDLFPAQAQALAAKATKSGKVNLVAEIVSEIDGGLIGSLGAMIAEEIGGLVMLQSGGRLCIASAAATGIAANAIAHELIQRAELQGGGSERLAQLGGADTERFSDYRGIILAMVEKA